MKDLPIIFTGTDPAKIRAGTKTQTRRIIKPQPVGTIRRDVFAKSGFSDAHGTPARFQYGVGMRLWVREAYRIFDSTKECACYDDCICSRHNGKPIYRADCVYFDMDKWKSPVCMPRELSRTRLEVVSVRAERLQDISDNDAWDEGVDFDAYISAGACKDAPRVVFMETWERIHGPGSWALNPVVEVIEFKVVQS